MPERVPQLGDVIHQSGVVSPSFFTEKTTAFDAIDTHEQNAAYELFDACWQRLETEAFVVPSEHPATQLAMAPQETPTFLAYDIFTESVDRREEFTQRMIGRLSSYITLSRWNTEAGGPGEPGFVITHQCMQSAERVPAEHTLAQIVLTAQPETSHTSFLRITPVATPETERQQFQKSIISICGVDRSTLTSVLADLQKPAHEHLLASIRRQRDAYQQNYKEPLRLTTRGARPLLSSL